MKDNYLEEAFKMRNLLEEFLKKHGVRCPTILGLREHIFTGRLVSCGINVTQFHRLKFCYILKLREGNLDGCETIEFVSQYVEKF